jgi:hypothetical protein
MKLILPTIPFLTDLMNHIISVRGTYEIHKNTIIIKHLFVNVWYQCYVANSEMNATYMLHELRSRSLISFLEKFKNEI